MQDLAEGLLVFLPTIKPTNNKYLLLSFECKSKYIQIELPVHNKVLDLINNR